ncbi:elongation factor 1 gamma [Acrodontium crateriforme]|uniref:Elongation factor 1 gamma n=1 Tax=Acrodontium crateriforme TaxID=150365 RepID=A0AAQ3MD45_9PEZI|nr:elongation factor 1 gamma [Acrodontium crateriforme]
MAHSLLHRAVVRPAAATRPDQTTTTPPAIMGGRNKLYTYKGGPRSIGILAVAHAIGLEIDCVETNPQNGLSDEYMRLNKLGKTPTFVAADGTVLTECMAICLYVASQDPEARLLGPTQMDFIQIVKWMSLCNTDVVKRIAAWIKPLIGAAPYSPEGVEVAKKETARAIQIFEDHLADRRYLVADALTLADVFCAGLVSFGFGQVFDREWRAGFPYFTAWFEMVTQLDMYRAVVPHTVMVDTAIGPQAGATQGRRDSRDSRSA